MLTVSAAGAAANQDGEDNLPAILAKAGMALAAMLALAGCARSSGTTDSSSPDDTAPQVAAAPGAAPVRAPTLEAVRERGRINCGVPDNLPGFATRDVLGQWHGFDVAFCRAVAAAVLGDARQVRFQPLDTRARYNALQAGQVDLIARGAWTFTRDAGLGLDFVGISYYDSQGFLVGKTLADKSVDDLAGRKVCVQAGTANELNLVEHFKDSDKKPESVIFDSAQAALDAYRDGQCEALSGDISVLSSERTLLRDADDHVILTGGISKEPQGPVVRQDDGQWADIVGWTLNAMVLAEEFGVTSRTVIDDRARPKTPEIERLLNGDGYGRMLMLDEDWAFQVVRQVGNYGEVFADNLGPDTDLKLGRGQNALWNAEVPGLLYAPPMR